MGWLDALRGYAAIVVALFHLSPAVIGSDAHHTVLKYFDMGRYGVFLFFLVSGYVIPMSLEKHGSLRKFWVGRLFRIYPAYLTTIALIAVLVVANILNINQGLKDESVTGILGHITMLHEFLGLRGLVWPFWTLAYEMMFYLIVAGLFAWGVHRHSAWWAAGLALVALVGGPRLPDALIGDSRADRRTLAIAVAVLFVAVLAAYISGRRPLIMFAGVVSIEFLALPLFNGHATKWPTASASWQALLMLSLLFAGTVIYRLHHGQVGRRLGGVALGIVLLAAMLTTAIHTGQARDLVVFTTASLAVAATFAGAFALRHRSMPRVLTWLGEISFSVYLLHLVVLYTIQYLIPADKRDGVSGHVTVFLVFAVSTLVVAWLCYRFVEMPGQTLGRKVQKRLQERLGPDVEPPAKAPAPVHHLEPITVTQL
jgi:peptidoglycan/LPS O-acetylase OafA/YrhL